MKKGEKIDLIQIGREAKEFYIVMDWQVDNNANYDIDGAAFLLQPNGKVKSENDFIFYNNPMGANGSINHSKGVPSAVGGKEKVSVKLFSIPQDIDKVAFTITIHDADRKRQSFGSVKHVSIKVIDAKNNQELLVYNITGNLTVETAIVAAELYRRNGSWKFGAVGSGFAGGLGALCERFGVEVLADTGGKPSSQKKDEYNPNNSGHNPQSRVEQKPININREIPKNEPVQPKINLSKIELKKKGETVKLEKKNGQTLGDILVNLNWNKEGSSGSGFFGSFFSQKKVDLDLGCLFELKDGSKGVVQALGDCFGNYNSAPYIRLDNDDRTGANVQGENLMINGNFLSEIKRILVFTYIYEGVANWAEVDGVITIKQKNGPDIEVRLDDDRRNKGMCGIAMITNENDTAFRIERIVQYFSGHRELDSTYGWGMRWVQGSK